MASRFESYEKVAIASRLHSRFGASVFESDEFNMMSRSGAHAIATAFNGTSSQSADPVDNAGNTLTAARVISLGATTTSFQDFVGTVDTNDYYRFTLSDTRNFALTMNGMTSDADVQLLNSTGGVISSSVAGGTSPESITSQLSAGTYYIRVYPFSGSTNYTLNVSAAPVVALPIVTIAATDASAAEVVAGQTQNPGQFTITRSGNTTSAVTVNYTISGSATKGSDYNNINSSTGNTGIISFASGQTTATINVNVIDDTIGDPNETVIVTLNSSTGYSLGSTTAATITIADNEVAPPPPPTPPTFATKAASGIAAIDALLGSDRGYWNTANNGGAITYSFYTAASGAFYGSEVVSEVSAAVKANVRNILSMLSNYIPVTFAEVADTTTSFGVIRYMFSNAPSYAYAYMPGSGNIAGDVFFNPNYETDSLNSFSGAAGNHGYATIIHETLHALGLKHPGNYNGSGTGTGPFLPGAEDNETNSIMSYNFAGSNPITPMAYDLRALNYLYGIRQNNNTNTTYTFTSISSYTNGSQTFGTAGANKQLLWDSGGIDTLNFSGLSTTSSYRFDLRGGGILTTQSAYNSSTYTDRSGGGTFTTSSQGTSIAFDSLIENLVTSRANDYIVANSAANTFSGYTLGTNTGADIYEGTNASDTLDLASFSLTNVTTTISGSNLTIGLGSNGSIQITNYFGTSGSMRTRIGSNYYRYVSGSGWQLA